MQVDAGLCSLGSVLETIELHRLCVHIYGLLLLDVCSGKGGISDLLGFQTLIPSLTASPYDHYFSSRNPNVFNYKTDYLRKHFPKLSVLMCTAIHKNCCYIPFYL